ncbi:hypothetical protein EYA84_21385, partial [Verrucosispora sp. SN26_14.1]
GDHRRAAELHLAAAEIYAGIPDVTDRMLALTFAVREFTAADDPAASSGPLTEVRAFAHRNGAPGLLRLARPPETGARTLAS